MTRAVLLDWRGTLAVTLDDRQRVQEALRRLGRDVAPPAVAAVVAALDAADPGERRRDAPGVDSCAARHRATYLAVFAEAGLDLALAEAVYAVESDPLLDVFADDVAELLRGLRDRGLRVAVVSDVHVDVRPAFATAALDRLVDAFVLSYEQGVQKPDPEVFRRALAALEVEPQEALMVGDRSGPDGAAVELGIRTLLLPPLRSPRERRLHAVLALCDAAPPVVA